MSKYTYTVENLERAINMMMKSTASLIAKKEFTRAEDLAAIFTLVLNVYLAKEGMKDNGHATLPDKLADSLDEVLEKCPAPSFAKLCRGEV